MSNENNATKYFNTYEDITNLINDSRLPCAIFWDSDISDFVCLEDHEIIPVHFIKLPTLDDLVPYNEAVKEFLESLEIIPNKNPIRFIWDAGLTQEFQDYRLQEAVKRLIKWGTDFGIYIGLEKENPIPVFQPCHSFHFKNYLVSQFCKKAYILASEVAENKKAAGLYGILGAYGMGKSHLLHATIQRSNELLPMRTTHLIDENSLLWEYKHALELQKQDALQQFYLSVDLLAVDNLDLILEDEECGSIIMSVLTERVINNKQTIYSSKEQLHDLGCIVGGKFHTEQICPASLSEKRAVAKHMLLILPTSSDIESNVDNWCQEADNFRELSGHICKYIALAKLSSKNTGTSQSIISDEQSVHNKWKEVKEHVRNQLSVNVYNTWVKSMRFHHLLNNICYISVPCEKERAIEYINTNLCCYFEEAFEVLCNHHYTVQFISRC